MELWIADDMILTKLLSIICYYFLKLYEWQNTHSVGEDLEHSLGPAVEYVVYFWPHKIIRLYCENGEGMQENVSIPFHYPIEVSL